jgi:HK97 family phage prohead protease
MKYDFAGYATRNDVLCSDGRTIRKGAFSNCNGKTVPLVWNHDHNSPFNVLGHALLEERDDGMYAYCTFNGTEAGKVAKEEVQHGDVVALSIFANNLKQNVKDVVHGMIREVSLVLAGANPGAYIEDVVTHGESEGECAQIYTVEDSEFELQHSDEPDEDVEETEESLEHADDEKLDENETVAHAIGRMDDNQKKAMLAVLSEMMDGEKNEGDDEDVKHNVFDEQSQPANNTYLSHADQTEILAEAKRCGSFREALHNHLGEDGVLAHSIDTTGMDTATGHQTYGFNDASMFFPDPRNLNNPPDWIKRDTSWVSVVLGGTHKTAFTRIKSMFADITEDAARARGYIKGTQKKEEVFTTLKRTTTPQTVYKLQKLDRDDILDITDFDVVAWIRAEMKVMLDEEVARAILIGDGRPSDDDYKISEDHIRPIATDVPLFNVKVEVDAAVDDTSADIARNTINTIIRSRKEYKGSGNPIFFTTEDVLTEMLLLEDGIGHKLYRTEQELATALRVSRIVTVEVMEGHTIKIGNADKPLIGIIVNLNDYNVGVDRGGQTTMFDDFDIDYNQYKYLLETRLSGALVKPFSALTVYLDQATA